MRSPLQFVVLLLFAAIAAAQNPASAHLIKVTVQDTSGAVISGAQVVVADVDGKPIAQGTTDDAGPLPLRVLRHVLTSSK
jgi:hypothetical protein